MTTNSIDSPAANPLDDSSGACLGHGLALVAAALAWPGLAIDISPTNEAGAILDQAVRIHRRPLLLCRRGRCEPGFRALPGGCVRDRRRPPDGRSPRADPQIPNPRELRRPGSRAVRDFLANNGIEVAGIESIRRPDGAIVTYDVNTNTNYNPQAEAEAGLYGMRELARFLGQELAAGPARAA